MTNPIMDTYDSILKLFGIMYMREKFPKEKYPELHKMLDELRSMESKNLDDVYKRIKDDGRFKDEAVLRLLRGIYEKDEELDKARALLESRGFKVVKNER